MKKLTTLLLGVVAVCASERITAQCGSAFYDGFESGSYTPTWTLGPGLTSGAVTTTNPAVGSYRLEGTGGVSTHLTGFSTTIASATPSTISWYIYPTGTGATNYFIAGDNAVTATNCVMFCYWLGSSNVIRFVSGSTYQYTCTPGSWYHIEMRNINWTAHTFDIWINNAQVSTAFPFRSVSQNSITKLHLYNFNNGVGVWDDIQLGGVPINMSSVVTNPLCYGGNGDINLTVSGGVSPFTYAWSNSASTEDVTGVPAGTYSVIATGSNGCADTLSNIVVSEPPQIVATTASVPATCNGTFTGSASVSASGGTGSLGYSWSPLGGTNDTATGLAAFTYTCTITDANMCSVAQTVTVTEPPQLTATSVASDVTCFSAANGYAVSVPAGGTAPYSYSWNTIPVQTTDTASGLAMGTYSCTVTDANGCSVSQSVQITEPTALAATVSSTDNLCYGDSAGTAVAVASGGTGAYSYSWNSSPAQLTDSASGLPAGTYICTITDANNCMTADTVTITDPAQLVINTSSQNIACFGGNSGWCGTSVTGGTPGYMYLWSTGTTMPGDSNLVAGCYYVQIYDQNGCSAIDTICLTEPPALVATGVTANSTTCGGSNGSVDLTPTGGTQPYTYSWSNITSNEDLTGVGAGTYSVTITDANSCTTTYTFTISDPDPPAVTVNLATTTVCVDDGAFALSGGSPSGGTWSGTGVSGGSFSPTTAGVGSSVITYTFTDSNNCTGSGTGTIQVNACVGVIEQQENALQLFPNPLTNGSNVVTLQLPVVTDKVQVTLTGVDGKTVYSESFTNRQRIDMALDGIAGGTYMVTVTAGTQRMQQRLVIVR
jgi:hypothetical protein